jgi:hypothetical protein
MESLDLLSILGRERQVQMSRLFLGLAQAQRSLALWQAKLDSVRRRPLRDNNYAERFECLEKERLARCIVADSEFHVVKHGSPEVGRPALRLVFELRCGRR